MAEDIPNPFDGLPLKNFDVLGPGPVLRSVLPPSGGLVLGNYEPVGPGPVLKIDRDVAARIATRPRAVHNRHGLGYLPDVPDRRDFGFSKLKTTVAPSAKTRGFDVAHLAEIVSPSEAAQAPAKNKKPRVGGPPAVPLPLPPAYRPDIVNLYTPVEDQLRIGACTAHAVIGLAEYLIRAGTKETVDLSRMFLYKVTRNLMGVHGDTGAYIRTAIKAMAAFGAPPEENWPYESELLDQEPMAFQYAYAANYKAMRYARIDESGLSPELILQNLLRVIASGFPVAFGFPVHASIRKATPESPIIPFPSVDQDDVLLGGHAVLAVGYDTELETPETRGKGALIIRNSWNSTWGYHGYGYLPFEYVRQGLAVDFWTIYSSDWLVKNEFQ